MSVLLPPSNPAPRPVRFEITPSERLVDLYCEEPVRDPREATSPMAERLEEALLERYLRKVAAG